MNASHVHSLCSPTRTRRKTDPAFPAPGFGTSTTPIGGHICLLIGLIGIWLLAHPYHGIRHDNTLYALQALNHLVPESFQREIFVQYGAQDQYTIFTSFYAAVIARFGLHQGTLVLLIAGQVLWALAATLLLHHLLTGRWLWAALVVLFISSGAYGSYRIFHFAEPFVTPRLFAESLGLMALYFLIRGRLLAALLALAGAVLLHPIMALATAMVALVYLILQDLRWLWIGAAAIATVVVLGLCQIQPFVQLLQTMEPSWRHMVEWRNYCLFISKFPLTDWSYLLHTSIIVLMSAGISKGRQRQILFASLIAAWSGLAISVVGGDWLSNVLILQLQLWRTLWLLHVLYALAIALLLRWCWPWHAVRVVVCSLLTLAWLSRNWGVVGLPLSCILMLTVFAVETRQIRTFSLPLQRLALMLSGIAVGIIGGVMVLFSTAHEANSESWQMALLSLLVASLLPPLFVGWMLHHHVARQRLPLWVSRVGFVALCLTAMLLWNRQSAWSRYVEQATEAPAFFSHLIPPDATVLWTGNTKNAWFGMRRSVYLNQRQGAGLVFSAQFAAIYKQRLHVVSRLFSTQPLANPRWNSERWQVDQEQFQHTYKDVCQHSAGLDYIVATVRVPHEPIGHWRAPVPQVNKSSSENGPHFKSLYEDFYLYDCARYRT